MPSTVTTISSAAWPGFILWLPLISLALCGLCAAMKVRSKLPAWITVACLGLSFILVCIAYAGADGPTVVHLFDWFTIEWGQGAGKQSFVANFSLYIDQLTMLWMLFVTGLGTLIALYASEYMEADTGRGYSRFFAGISVFLFAMSALVMADNLVMLYLGWEGVGFASYWLIGYYYVKPSAVEAAKKAFIMNRIGDLGLALGIWLTYHVFGTVEFVKLFPLVEAMNSGAAPPTVPGAGEWSVTALPFLFMLGAFGKSAQIPLYVWLPDAMEGPTPVSALIHAATMVTAGVYLIARMLPLMLLHPDALPTVAWIGGLTALLAATIGMAQYDIKRIMAYSTVSQLGYMFLGLGLLTSVGAAYHVFTHAFFKAVLFLTCGAIMHGFAGQLDLRRLSGLRHLPGWKITSYTMLYGCLCLAGFPIITSGFWSKDLIVAEAFAKHQFWLGLIAIFTALLTAYYTFRVWFRVCAGPVHYEAGQEHQAERAEASHEAARAPGPAHHAGTHGHGAAFHPHAPRLAINLVLAIITAGAFLAIWAQGWVQHRVAGSTAAVGLPHEGDHEGFFSDPHSWMPWLAGLIALVGIAIAWYFHLANRKAADAARARLLANPLTRWLPTAMERKWYVDELYDGLVRAPLWTIGHVLHLFDRYVIDFFLVDGIAKMPRAMGRAFQPLSNGVLQSYAISMVGGLGLAILLVVMVMPNLRPWLLALFGGGG